MSIDKSKPQIRRNPAMSILAQNPFGPIVTSIFLLMIWPPVIKTGFFTVIKTSQKTLIIYFYTKVQFGACC